jgi:hypothetical protein
MPVLRTIINRFKEFNPYAFKVFGPKIIAMRGSFDDRALESRFFTEETGRRPLRGDIAIHVPKEMKTEALELRNRLLHFRFCNFFTIKPRPEVLMANVEPRLNQAASSLLSLVDDLALRGEMQRAFVEDYEATRTERSETAEAAVLRATNAAFITTGGANVSVGEVTYRFNRENSARYGGPRSNRWIGHILRTRLHLTTRKSDGLYVIAASEKSKIESLMARMGLK